MVSQDRATALQPGQQSETLSQKTNKKSKAPSQKKKKFKERIPRSSPALSPLRKKVEKGNSLFRKVDFYGKKHSSP